MKLFVWSLNGVLEQGLPDVRRVITNYVFTSRSMSYRLSDSDSKKYFLSSWQNIIDNIMHYGGEKKKTKVLERCFQNITLNPNLMDPM